MGRTALYPYHLWFDGEWHSLTREDLNNKGLVLHTLRSILHQYAKAHNFTVRTVEWPNGRFDFCARTERDGPVKLPTDDVNAHCAEGRHLYNIGFPQCKRCGYLLVEMLPPTSSGYDDPEMSLLPKKYRDAHDKRK